MTKRSGREGGLNLIELVVVIAILAAIAAFVMPRYLQGSSKRADGQRGPVAAARDTVCKSNLSQVRTSLQTLAAGDPDGRPPSDLAGLGLPAEVQRCPIGGEPYRYDAASGRVQCVHPGHEAY